MQNNYRRIFTALAVPLLLVAASAAQSGYVANFNANTVSVIDTSTNSVVGSPIPVGARPSGVALTPDGKRAYVTNEASPNPGSVSVIDTSSNTVIATIPDVGIEPINVNISPDGTRAWVACSGQFPVGSIGSVAIIDTATNTVVSTMSSGFVHPIATAFSPDGTRAFVTDNALGEVQVFDTATNALIQIIASPTGTRVLGMAMAPDGKHLYVTSTPANSIFTIDTSTFAVSLPLVVGVRPNYLAISPDGSKVYVVNAGPIDMSANGSLVVVDTATNTITATIPLGLDPYMPAVSADGSEVFVTNAGALGVPTTPSSISVINTATNTVTATITAAGIFSSPVGIAIQQQAFKQSPAQMVTSLLGAIQAMHLPKLGSSLTGQLQVVADDIAAQNGLECSDLAAFAHHVEAQSGKSITPADASQLLQTVASIEAALNCGP
jgi:YVTN family beta-propeller protein